jgi:hypothetical protein
MSSAARSVDSPPSPTRAIGLGLRPVRSVLDLCYRNTYFIAGLLAIAAAGGLFFGVYRDNLWVSSQVRGQDFVSLFVAVPLLLASLRLARRGSVVGQLIWLGVLGYVTYSYLYIFGIAWNRLFLIYLALLTLSAFTLVRALIAIEPEWIASRLSSKTPVRAVSRYLFVFAVGMTLLWGAQALAATLTGDIPQSVSDSGHPTGVVFVLDLGLVVPLFFVGARLLRRREAWGFVLGGILLVKGIAEGLALLGMSLFMYLDGYPDIDVALVPLWALVAITSLALSIPFFRSVQPAEEVQK